MRKITILLLLVSPIVCFSQAIEKAKTVTIQKDRSFELMKRDAKNAEVIDQSKELGFEKEKVAEYGIIAKNMDKGLYSQSSELVKSNLAEENVGLPQKFLNRAFLINTAGCESESELSLLMGQIVKKVKTANGFALVPTGNCYRIKDAKIVVGKSDDGLLAEVKCNASKSATVNFLIGQASASDQVGYEFLLNDICQASIAGDQLDKEKLNNIYKSKEDVQDYYIVVAAINTKIYSKSYQKKLKKADFSYSAIKIEGEVYCDYVKILQDNKVGMRMISLAEFING